MRVLISGCGYVGSALGLLLAAEGHTIFGLRRNTKALPTAIRPTRADLSKPLPPDTLPPDLDVVVHAASPGGSTDEAYRLAYAQGPRNLFAALEPQQILRRLVFVSSTGVYAQKNGEWVDEESSTEPETTSGKRLLQGESLALGCPFPTTVLRLGGIYGPGRTGAIERALGGAPEEDPPRYTNRIHRDDCAGVLRHLILLPDPAPVYLGVDNEPATRHTIAEWLASRLGARTGARLDETAALTRSPPRGGPRDASRSRTNKRCSNARLIHSGYHFHYPTFREGFAALLLETPTKEPGW